MSATMSGPSQLKSGSGVVAQSAAEPGERPPNAVNSRAGVGIPPIYLRASPRYSCTLKSTRFAVTARDSLSCLQPSEAGHERTRQPVQSVTDLRDLNS